MSVSLHIVTHTARGRFIDLKFGQDGTASQLRDIVQPYFRF